MHDGLSSIFNYNVSFLHHLTKYTIFVSHLVESGSAPGSVIYSSITGVSCSSLLAWIYSSIAMCALPTPLYPPM